DARRPIDKLPQRLEITDPEIGFRAQGKERREDPRDFLLRRQVHTSHNGHKGHNGRSCLATLRDLCALRVRSQSTSCAGPASPRLIAAGFLSENARGAGTCRRDRKSTRLNSSHRTISYAVFCLKKKK